jgi:hypothetical protein
MDLPDTYCYDCDNWSFIAGSHIYGNRSAWAFVVDDIKNAVLQAVVASAREDKPKEEKCVTQTNFIEAITEVIEANKASYQQPITITPAEGEIPLPNDLSK